MIDALLKAGLDVLTDVDGLNPGINANNLDAGLVVRPRTVEEVSRVCRIAGQTGASIVPHGGRTGLAGGAISRPGQIVVDLSRMNAVLEIDPKAGIAVAEAGATLESLQSAAATAGLSIGIDYAARGSATVGGMISTNAGGIEAFRYGMTRHRVLGLEAVLADGTVVNDMKRVLKANEGLDVKQLFIGAEGTLGIVTKAVFALTPLDRSVETALFSLDGVDAAVEIFSKARAIPDATLSACEIMFPRYARTVAGILGQEGDLAFEEDLNACFLLLESANGHGAMEGLFESCFEAGLIRSGVLAKNAAERETLWRIRENSFVLDERYPGAAWFDVSVPLKSLPAYMLEMENRIAAVDPNLVAYVMGHLGDGNLHLTVAADRPMPEKGPAIRDAVYFGPVIDGGSFSAEHGIGMEKTASLMKVGDSGALAVMHAVKRALDPKNIMNPGKILPD